jgi:glycosyltransferase involved in cell wall biosynthesis
MSIKHALVCSYYPPEFDRDSGSRRILDLIELLCGDGWRVTFVASNRMNDPRYSRVLQQLGVAVYDGAKISIEELLVTTPVDLALLAFWPVADVYLPIIRRLSPATRIIVDSIDLHFLRNCRKVFREAANAGGVGVLDSRLGTEFSRELNVYAASDGVLTVSRKEADLINDLIAEPGLSHAVPDKESAPASAVPLEQRRGIVFLGSFRHLPNVGAVEFLCKEIVPRLNPALTARHPIYIVGEGLDDSVCRLGEGLHQVRMVGWVPSVAPYLERARLSVIPLRFGAGTKRKLLQAVMTGTPTVSTSIGVEGFDLRDGEDVLVADDPATFADAICRLLEDDALWKKLSHQGREHLLAIHGQAAVQQRLCKVIEKVLETAPKSLPSHGDPETLTRARMDLRKYEEMREKVKQLMQTHTSPNAKVLILSHGDEELIRLEGRTGWHFPQRADGIYEGYHPADSTEAISKLEGLRSKGAEYLVIPGTSLWWLDHYWDFQVHLKTHYTELIRQSETCAIYALVAPPLRTDTPSLQAVSAASEKGAEDSLVKVDSAVDRDDAVFGDGKEAVRLIAFYLPQFHPIPENDAWWGEGFTEWTNVGKAKPLFDGHYQPHVPADLGFYDLRLEDTRQAQAELARRSGIHAFCYYHYWFGGKKLLERPFEEVLRSSRPDFPFCLCWANEPWSRRWDGCSEDVLQAQTYGADDDVAHIRFLLPALADERAVRIENKPVFLIYQGRDLPEPARTVETWRREVERAGLPGIYLMSVETGWDAGWDATEVGFDAKVLFQPQFTMLFNSGAQIQVPQKEKLKVFDYDRAWPVLANPEPVAYRRYETVFPGWDNSPRTGENAVILVNNSPEAYQEWLARAIERARMNPPDHRIVFINAWNEWGEGCHLEPDLTSGAAYLQATKRSLASTLTTG